MLPSRGLTRAHGLVSQSQILSRAQVRSIPRQATSRPAIASTRQFGLNLRSNGRPSTVNFLSGSRIGAAGIVSSSTLLSSRRFASTDSTKPTPSAASTPSSSPELTPDSDFSPEFSVFSDLDGPSLFNIPEKVGYLKELGLDYGWGPTSMMEWSLEHMHFGLGLPWWASIVGLAVGLRVAMAYPALVAQDQSVKSRDMRKDPLYKEVQAKLMVQMTQLGSGGARPEDVMQVRMQQKLLHERAGVQTWKMFLPMLQFPLVLGSIRLLRTMAALPVPGLDTAGTLWFTDLTMADPFMILPCIGTVLMVMSIKRATAFMTEQQASMMRLLPWVLGPLTILFTMNLSATVQLYLASTAILQYVQTTAFHVAWVRRVCGLPPLEEMIENPKYQASKPHQSPFSRQAGQNQGIRYEAPRTITTTATEKGVATRSTKSGGAADSNNPVEYFKGIIEQMREAKESATTKAREWQGNRKEKNLHAQKKSSEKRAIKEDHEKYLKRKREQLERRQSKK